MKSTTTGRALRLASAVFLLLWPAPRLHAAAVREPAVAGQFYAASTPALFSQIRGLLQEAEPPSSHGRPAALISPHAGYIYSGRTAAYGYQALEGTSFRRVLLLGPSHYAGFHGLSIADVKAYRTPLGEVPLDLAACDTLRSHPLIGTHTPAHGREHSLEVQIPFLQSVLSNFRIVPLLVGRLDPEDYGPLARALGACIDDTTLIVVSSDFTHYGARFDYLPFQRDIPQNLSRLDHEAIRKILQGDREGFLDFQKRTGDTICGFRAIALLLEILRDRGIGPGELLSYTTSGAVTGNFRNSVSYASILFYRRDQAMYLTPDEKKNLLRLAREAVTSYVREDKEIRTVPPGVRLTERLREPAGAFVTLEKHGELRGCIGYIDPIRPLYESVMENAVSACARDYRFPPVREAELRDISLEISVLTPKKEIPNAQAFVPGEQGIILEKKGRRAVFLPQVATEQGWGREETLQHLCLKAGLGRNDWKEGARFWVFTAEVFGEGEEK